MFASPVKALTFSPSFRTPLITMHHGRAKPAKASPIRGPQTRPSLPSVKHMFCMRWGGLGPGLVSTPTSAAQIGSRYGAMASGPTRMQISPMAQDALLLTVTEVFAFRLAAHCDRISGRWGTRNSMQYCAQSPTRAKALCFTLSAESFSTSGRTMMKFCCWSTSEVRSRMPSTMPARRSRLAATTSRSGFSNSFGFCCHICAARAPERMSLVHRSTTRGTIGRKDGPRLFASHPRHSKSATVERSLSGVASNFSTRGAISACTY
mmetsp:Transcript_1793/g.3580  ORF Transcript_1793/g.3580 Transcript_1793/m.3580 type:complete len:264 (-) Transcript_1793:1641-2432(-)